MQELNCRRVFKAWHTSLNALSTKRLSDVGNILAIIKALLHFDGASCFCSGNIFWSDLKKINIRSM